MNTLNFMSIFGIDIINGLRLLCAWLCETVYMLIAGLYDLFINISRVELLTSEQIHPIYQRITMILTIVMVFYVTFETVKFVIQPEQFSDKEKGASKIVVRMVLVVLLIAFVPQIFSGAYWVQNKIFDTQVFSKVILGKQDVDSQQFGKNLSYNIFSLFYSLDTESFSESELESKKCGNIPCKQVVLMNYNQLRSEGKLTFLTEGLNEKDKITDSTTGEKVEKYYINFNGLFAVVVGGFIAYMLLLYCVDAGVRVVQLLFLQIIAPIPIMAYLSPKKDGMFEKWTKQCLTTYLDLFLRVGIIYFILLICQILGNAFTNGTLVNNVSSDGTWLIYIALIMGLLLFAHKAPKMLQELFPKMGAASGNFGLSMKDRPVVARAAGMTIGASLVGAKGLIGNTVNRAKRNYQNREQRKKDQEAYAQSSQNYREAKQHRRNINRQINQGQYMVDEKYTDENGVERTRRRAATAEEIKAKRKELNQNVKDRKIDKDSAKADRDNTKYRFEGFSAVAGLAGGVVRGATIGAKATDEKGIVKQVKEGLKAQDAAMAKTEKWYDEGGGNYFDRIVTTAEESLGINTSSDVIANEIKREEQAIKINDALITTEADVKKKSDDVESRLESKLNTDSKATIDSTAEAYLRNKVPGIIVTQNESIAALRKKYKSKTETAQTKLEKIVKNSDPTTQEGRDAIATAEAELARARATEELVNKHTMRAVYTQHLSGTQISDPVVSQKISLMKQSVATARRSVKTVSSMQNEVREGRLSNADFEAFMTGNFNDYDQLDNVITRLQTIINERTLENQQRQENKRRLETSSAYAAAKADKTSSGGK